MSDELKRVEVLIEGMRSDFKVAAEGHSTLIHMNQETKEELLDKIQTVETKISGLVNRVIRIEEKLDRVDQKLDLHLRVPA